MSVFVEFSVCVFRLTWCYTSPFCVVMFPMEHRQALEQKGRENGHTQDPQTTSLSLTETWCRVIWERTG